jgi:hypothetical protein
MDYKAWYTMDVDPVDYYAQVAEAAPLDPQETARTRDADGTMPGEAQDKLFNISAEIKNLFHEFGSPMPPLMEGCTVLDLCCGSGRDTYLAAQLVGIRIGIDDFGDTRIDEHLGARHARLRVDIYGGARNVDAVFRRLDNRILLGMQTAADLLTLP